MKREIKFRAMTKANNVMVFGDLIICPNGEHRILWVESKGELPLDVDYKSFNETVQSSTIGQLTGLKNDKGIEVYDGDIVQVGGLIEVVKYIDGILCCYSENIYGKHEKVDIDTFEDIIVASSDYFEPYEIIGNIYQNPELLSTI